MVPRALVLPALGIALLPKCPMCVMAIFLALGLAHPHHETVFALVKAVAVVGAVALIVVRHRRAPARIALAMAAAGAVLMGVAGVGWPVLGYAGALLLVLVWLVKPAGGAAPSCACAPAALAPEA